MTGANYDVFRGFSLLVKDRQYEIEIVVLVYNILKEGKQAEKHDLFFFACFILGTLQMSSVIIECQTTLAYHLSQ